VFFHLFSDSILLIFYIFVDGFSLYFFINVLFLILSDVHIYTYHDRTINMQYVKRKTDFCCMSLYRFFIELTFRKFGARASIMKERCACIFCM